MNLLLPLLAFAGFAVAAGVIALRRADETVTALLRENELEADGRHVTTSQTRS